METKPPNPTKPTTPINQPPAINPNEKPSPSPPVLKKTDPRPASKKVTKIALSLILIIVAFVAGKSTPSIIKQFQTNQLPSPTPIVTPSPTPLPSPVNINIPEDWQTFENDFFTFQYPPNLYAYENSPQQISFFSSSTAATTYYDCINDPNPERAIERYCLGEIVSLSRKQYRTSLYESVDVLQNQALSIPPILTFKDTSGNTWTAGDFTPEPQGSSLRSYSQTKDFLDIISIFIRDNEYWTYTGREQKTLNDNDRQILRQEGRQLALNINASMEFNHQHDTSSWKTYISDQFNFQIMHPPNLTPEKTVLDLESSFLEKTEIGDIEIAVLKKPLSDSRKNDLLKNGQQINLGGTSVIKNSFTDWGEGGGPYQQFTLPISDHTLEIYSYGLNYNTPSEISEQIISTFQFTN